MSIAKATYYISKYEQISTFFILYIHSHKTYKNDSSTDENAILIHNYYQKRSVDQDQLTCLLTQIYNDTINCFMFYHNNFKVKLNTRATM